MIIVIILLLVAIIIGLIVYNMSIRKKINAFNNINQQITSLNVIQDFMNTISETTNVDEKLRRINEILIEKYNIKYSTIVVYNGAEYVIRASNVAERHWDVLRNLQSERIFKDSIETGIPKYITVNVEGEKLPYQKMEFGRAKSAMFFPLYIDNVYIGYWIIEGSNPHEFDNVDTTILEVVKNNIVAVLKTVENQSTIEKIVKDDKYSQLKTAEFLYTEGKKIIDQYTTSTICLFKITNLEQINEKVSRKTGNNVITQICRTVQQDLSPEYLFVRYMGPKFAIVFSGVQEEAVEEFMKTLKLKVEALKIESAADYKGEKVEVSPKINIALATYYKGTALVGVTKKLEEYLDTAEPSENNINYL
ncbi:MAG: diguanylate cyclase domain-containing protein [Clostridia bacterium]